MPDRPLTPCRRPGCPALLAKPGYCPEHQPAAEERRLPFIALDEAKTSESIKFYASRRWTEVSRRHRRAEPLCRRCRARGLAVAAQMVHHNPPVEELRARGLSPYDDAYLESLCNRCHLDELRAKRGRSYKSVDAPGGLK